VDALPALLLDFDGVLAPLVADPAAAALDPACAAVLRARPASWRLAVISGRSCDDLLPRVARLAPDAIAGDHGLEIRLLGEGRTWIHPGAIGLRRRVLAAARALGGRLEEKRLTAKVREPAAAPRPRAGVRYLAGRGGVDVLPDLDWDKGRAADWLLAAWGAAALPAVYAGDEATDEEAFARLAPRGVRTLRVAPAGPSAAAETLAGQAAVAGWLRALLAAP
jgi:alpha,alpha-trehalase